VALEHLVVAMGGDGEVAWAAPVENYGRCSSWSDRRRRRGFATGLPYEGSTCSRLHRCAAYVFSGTSAVAMAEIVGEDTGDAHDLAAE
jgi:hypothetical protein